MLSGVISEQALKAHCFGVMVLRRHVLAQVKAIHIWPRFIVPVLLAWNWPIDCLRFNIVISVSLDPNLPHSRIVYRHRVGFMSFLIPSIITQNFYNSFFILIIKIFFSFDRRKVFHKELKNIITFFIFRVICLHFFIKMTKNVSYPCIENLLWSQIAKMTFIYFWTRIRTKLMFRWSFPWIGTAVLVVNKKLKWTFIKTTTVKRVTRL